MTHSPTVGSNIEHGTRRDPRLRLGPMLVTPLNGLTLHLHCEVLSETAASASAAILV